MVASQYMNFPNRFLIEGPLRSTAKSQYIPESETCEDAREFAGRQSKSLSAGLETFIREFCDFCNWSVSCLRVHVNEVKQPGHYRVLGG
jgi:hypothetical protein